MYIYVCVCVKHLISPLKLFFRACRFSSSPSHGGGHFLELSVTPLFSNACCQP